MAITSASYPLLVASPTLQDLLVDKDTGLPLAGGIVTFYKDDSRQQFKNVYYQTGTPGAYNYIPTSNPMTLTAIGTFADPAGNDIIPFFYPYDESTEDQTPQAYYVTVDSAAAIRQFTREGFPFIPASAEASAGQQDLVNLIPNGQFQAHNLLPNNTFPNGTTSNIPNVLPLPPASTLVSTYVIAQGGACGWYFIKDRASTSTETITFPQIGFNENISGRPQYAIRIASNGTGGTNTLKQLRVRFPNVNIFSPGVQGGPPIYTFSIAAKSNSGFPDTISISEIQFFGTGSGVSTPTSTSFSGTFSCGNNAFTTQSVNFSFASNGSNLNVGPNGDDYIEIAIVFKTALAFDVTLTNVFLAPGEFQLSDYPQLPSSASFATGIAGSMPLPAQDGSNLYLPLVLTSGGVGFDSTVIGKPYASDAATIADNELLLDGTTKIAGNYSGIGIPFSRLGNYYLSNGYSATSSGVTWKIPQYGTGSGFVTAAVATNGDGSILYLSSNTFGAATLPTDVSSGFTIPIPSSVNTPFQASSLGVIASTTTTASVLSGITIRSINRNSSANPATGNCAAIVAGLPTSMTITIAENSPLTTLVVNIGGFTNTLANYTGKGFQWTNPQAAGNFYIWYSVNGSPAIGSPPAGTGTAVSVQLRTGDTLPDIIYKTAVAMQGGFLCTMQAVSESIMTGGGYFTFTVNSTPYAVWFDINGTSSAPTVPGATLIRVLLPGAALPAPQVAAYAVNAINSYSYALPDYRGMTLTGLDATGVWDPDFATRTSIANNLLGGALAGTLEYDSIASHMHVSLGGSSAGGSPLGPTTTSTINTPINSQFTGGAVTRPVNIAVKWVTRY